MTILPDEFSLGDTGQDQTFGPSVPITPNISSSATKRVLDQRVAEVSPALYAAGARSNLTTQERDFIEMWASYKQTHEKLMSMNNKDADAAYKKLDPQYQAALDAFYGVNYLYKPGNDTIIDDPETRKLLGLDNGLSFGDLVKSPFRLLMALGSQYGKYLNTGYNAAQNALINDTAFWSRKNFSDAFDGKMLYDESAVNPLINKYGGATSFVAMHLLAGETPGQIIASWGPNDAEILKAVNQLFNEPEAMATILDEFGNAQLSPGRDIARWIDKKFDLDPKVFDTVSGSIDFAWQIFADPMTYLSGGLLTAGKLAGRAEKLAEVMNDSRNVVEFFANTRNAKFFSGYANNVGLYKEAFDSGDLNKAAEVKAKIQKEFPEFGTDKEIEFWANAGVKDLDTFKAQFIDPKSGESLTENVSMLIRGLTNNTSYARENSAFARPTRELALGVKEKLGNFFTGKVDWKELDKTNADKLIDEIQSLGRDRSGTFDFTELDSSIRQSSGNRLQRFIERQSRKHPGSKNIYVDDDRVNNTLGVVRDQAFLALGNKMHAEIFTAHFLNSTEATRFELKRALDILTMRRMGMAGTKDGKARMDAIIADRYGEKSSFSVADKLKYPEQFGNANLDEVSISGPIQPYQFKDGITALPWRDISETVAKGKFTTKQDKLMDAIPDLIGGAYNLKATRMVTDVWSALTLIPTLGIRTAIDEGFMFLLTSTTGQWREYLAAKRAGNVLTAYSNDAASTGPVKNFVQNQLSKVLGRKVGALGSISDEYRVQRFNYHLEKLARNEYENPYQAVRAARSEIFDEALKKYGKRLPEQYKEWLKESAFLNPSIIKETSSSNLSQALLNTQGIVKTNASLLSPSQMDLMMKELNLEASGIFRELDPRTVANSDLQVAMFRNLWTAFNSDTFNFGGKKLQEAHPAYQFLKNNGLRTKEDFDKAVIGFMNAIGFEWNGKIWDISKDRYGDVQKFLNSSTHFQKYKDLSPADRAVGFITDSLADIYHRFHGSHDQFNEKLLGKFGDFISGKKKSFYPELNSITREEYFELTKDYLAKDRIFTDLELTTSTNFESWARKFGINNAFDMMSRQTDDILRQPLVHLNYFAIRKQYQQLEQAHLARRIKEIESTGVEPAKAAELAKDEVSRFWAEKSMSDAAHTVLKYADNPEVRSTFAYNVRTVGRFYRAVEDFHRRMYRLTRDNGLGTIYRLRLMNQGMQAVGAIHTDENGEEFAILPMDDVIYNVVNTTTRILTGNEVSVNQPLFNDITFKITAANPSFQTDAGMPYLSGPAGALSVLAVKTLLGNFDPAKNFAEDLDTIALGSLGDNVTIRSAVVPKFVNNVWKILSPNERASEEVSAYTQALSYYQANGYGINPQDYVKKVNGVIVRDDEAFDRAKRDYLANVKISAHNIVVMRSLLGMILPVSVQTSDSKDVPEYLKEVGTVSLKQSFYEVLDEVRRLYPDVEDHYELALATWMGDNPGKAVYLVSASNKDIKPVINYSNKMQDWAIRNIDSVEEYGAGALIFAPHTGDFNPGVWKWADSVGITTMIPTDITVQQYFNDFYDKVMLKQYANQYYALNDLEADQLRKVPFGDTNYRRATVQEFQAKRRILLLSTPGLENFIRSGADNTSAAEFIQSAHSFVNGPAVDVDPKVKDLINQSYDLYNNFINYANQVDATGFDNAPELKRIAKKKTIDKIQELIDKDDTKAVKQYFDYGLLKLMTAVSRDASAGINRNVSR